MEEETTGGMATPSHEGPSEDDKLGAILTALTKIEDRMNAMDQRLAGQVSALANIAEATKHLNQKVVDLENKAQETQAKAREEQELLDSKIAAMQEAMTKDRTETKANVHKQIIPPSSAPPASSCGHGGGGDAWGDYLANRAKTGPPLMAAGVAVLPPTTPPHMNATGGKVKGNQDKNKLTSTQSDLVWIKGYTRDLTTKQLRTEAARILAMHDVDEDDVDVIVRGFGRSMAIKFATADQARDFREEARDAAHEWVDPRDKAAHPLRFMGDKPLFVRLRDRVFAVLWQKTLPKVLAKHPGGKLGQSRGKLWAIVDECPVSLFSSRPDPDDPARFQLEADLSNCQDFGISRDEANMWIAAALRAAA
jgi:hypothetical protein